MSETLRVYNLGSASHSSPDLLEKAFQLASFIVSDRETAIKVLCNAIKKTKVQRTREEKRMYWRDKKLKRKITRTVRTDSDALQWLIYCESTSYEKRLEVSSRPTAREMVTRYVKHLIQMTTAMSSFYVNVGLQRVLRNYSTADAQKFYEYITGHCPNPAEYRRIKGVLMKQLHERFADHVKTCRIDHGEMRFEEDEDQDRWANLVNECLKLFTPWSTEQACLKTAGNDSTKKSWVPNFLRFEHPETQRDMVEAFRSHMFIDPACYGHLTARLGMEAPEEKLAVPRFHLQNDTEDTPRGSQMQNPKLTEEERRDILDQLAAEPLVRRDSPITTLAIVVDGEEPVRFDVDATEAPCLRVREGAKLIEIWCLGENTRVLKATHWLNYTEWQGIAEARAVAVLGNGRELVLDVVPANVEDENAGGASVFLKCRRTSLLANWIAVLWHRFSLPSSPRFAWGMVCLLMIAGLWGTAKYQRQAANLQSNVASLTGQLASEKADRLREQTRAALSMPAAVSYRLTSGSVAVRGATGLDNEQVISLPSGANQMVLELPVSDKGGNYRAVMKTFIDNKEVLSESLLKPQSSDGSEVVALPIPSAIVENRQYYVLDLYRDNGRGDGERIALYAFRVMKQ